MKINDLRLAAAKSVKFSALVLLLAIAVGCNARPNNPEVDEANVSSASESTTADTPDITAESSDRAASSPITPDNAPEETDVQTAASTVAEAPANSNSEVQVQSAIPMQFQGEWNMGVEGCGVSYSDGRLQIGLDRIDFYESSGNVQEVIVQGDTKMTVTAEYSSEGETFTRTSSFELSSDRSTLTHIETNTVRDRCPG